MDFINLDNTKGIYSNAQVFTTIKHVLKNEKNPLEKRLIISHLIRYVTNELLLENTIKLLENTTVLENTFANLTDIDVFIERQSITNPKDKTKLKAIVFSISLYHRLLLEKFKAFLQKSDLPELQFKIVDRKIEFNLSEITDIIKRKSVGFVRNEIISIPDIKTQDIEIKKMIQSMEVIDYDNDTNSFQNEINHFERIKNNLTPAFETKSNIDHKHIFLNNGFELFEYILETYITEKGKKGRFTDISFYYWKMVQSKFIHQKPESFKRWFFETYDKEDIGKMKTLAQCNTVDKKRDKHYSNSLEWFKQQKNYVP